MLDKEKERGDGGDMEQHHHQHDHQHQARAGVHSPVIMVTLVPGHGVMTSLLLSCYYYQTGWGLISTTYWSLYTTQLQVRIMGRKRITADIPTFKVLEK